MPGKINFLNGFDLTNEVLFPVSGRGRIIILEKPEYVQIIRRGIRMKDYVVLSEQSGSGELTFYADYFSEDRIKESVELGLEIRFRGGVNQLFRYLFTEFPKGAKVEGAAHPAISTEGTPAVMNAMQLFEVIRARVAKAYLAKWVEEEKEYLAFHFEKVY